MPREKKSTPTPKTRALKAVPKPEEPVKVPALTDAPDAPLGYHILASARVYTNALHTALAAKRSTAKLTVPRLQAMQVIAASDGITGADIARALNVTPQTVTTIISNLDAFGWIERRSGQGRAIETRLTARGRTQMNKGVEVVAKVDKELAGSFSYDDAEAAVLINLLRHGRQTFTMPQAA